MQIVDSFILYAESICLSDKVHLVISQIICIWYWSLNKTVYNVLPLLVYSCTKSSIYSENTSGQKSKKNVFFWLILSHIISSKTTWIWYENVHLKMLYQMIYDLICTAMKNPRGPIGFLMRSLLSTTSLHSFVVIF